MVTSKRELAPVNPLYEAMILAKLRQGRAILDAMLVADMVGDPPRLPVALECWRSVKLFQLHAALFAEVDRFMEYEMTEEKAGAIMAIEIAPSGDPIFIDDTGRKFTAPRGGPPVWRLLEDPAKPTPPSSKFRWRQTAAA